MLLNRKRAWIQLDTKNLDIGYDSCPESTHREDQELGDELGHSSAKAIRSSVLSTHSADCDRRVAEKEELVKALKRNKGQIQLYMVHLSEY